MITRSPNDAIKNLWQKIPMNIRVAFSSAFCIGLFTHLFMFTNTLPNHDELISLVGNLEWATSVNGRWFLSYAATISSIFSMPWVNGLLSIIYLSIAVCLIISTLRVEGYLYIVLISGVVITMPSIAGIFTYMQHADPFLLGAMLACLAAFLAERYKYGFIFAIIPVVLSLAIYQSFFSTTVAILILVLILDVLNNQTSWQKILLKGVRFVSTLAAGIVIYLVSVRIFYPDGLSYYQGLDRMGRLPLLELPNRIITAYREIIKFFVIDSRNFHYSFMNIIFVLAFVACAILIVLWIIRKKIYKEPIKLLLLGALLVLFPLGCNIIYVMGPTLVHDLMIFEVVFILVFLLIMADLYHKEKDEESEDDAVEVKSKKMLYAKIARISTWVITLAMTLTIFNYWIVSNQVYFKLNIAYQTTYAQSILLVSRIQNTPGYSYDKDIFLVGVPHVPQGIAELEQITITGAKGPELFGNWYYTYFLKYYLNFTQRVIYLYNGIQLVNCDELAKMLREMPIYPDYGSIAILDGVIYVRFAYIDECCWEFWPYEKPTCCIVY